MWRGRLGFAACALGLATAPAALWAEVVHDGSLQDGPALGDGSYDYVIDGDDDQVRGGNLLHSFSVFGVEEDHSAVFRFSGVDPVERVIGRVTGPDASRIDGALVSEIEGADVFLLNPNGVMFGSGASVSVPGAFRASTASSLLFGDGQRFEARPGAPVPAGLIEGLGDPSFGSAERRSQIVIEGAFLRNRSGLELHSDRIRILDGATLSTSNAPEEAPGSGDLSLRAESRIELRGLGAYGEASALITAAPVGQSGDIALEAPEIQFRNGAFASVRGRDTSGSLTLRADTLRMSGRDGNGFPTEIVSGSLGPGDSGSVLIEAREVRLRNTLVSASPRDAGVQAGDIHFDVDQMRLRGVEIAASGIDGAGAITIDADSHLVLENSTLRTRDPGDGEGRIEIEAGRILLDGDSVLDGDVVVVSAPPPIDVEALEDSAAPAYADPARLFHSACRARESGERQGSFTVARNRGLRTPPDGLLHAADPVPLAAVAAGPRSREPAPPAFEETARGAERSAALQRRARSEQREGRYDESLDSLRAALAESDSAPERATALGLLGDALVAQADYEAGREALRESITIAHSAGDAEQAAAMSLRLGNLEAAAGRVEAALEAYASGAELAAHPESALVRAQALSSRARSALAAGLHKAAYTDLSKAAALLPALAPPDRLTLLLHHARSWAQLAEEVSDRRDEALLAGHRLLGEAIEIATEHGLERELSYARGNLGRFYEIDGRFDEALYLSRRAARDAERTGATQALVRWRHQEGRILRTLGRSEEAARAYQRALVLLEEMRPESRARYGASRGYFHDELEPIYLELVDLLTRSHDRIRGEAERRALLEEARLVAERMKAAELRDYFRDACIADLEARSVRLDQVSPTAAVVYPIPLEDRTELLIGRQGGIERYTAPVGRDELEAVARLYRAALQSPGSRHRMLGSRLYDWLVRPYADALQAQGVRTLVVVPDGALRAVPFASLHDGEGYLVERFALAVAPSLELIDPKPLSLGSAKALVAGLSQSVEGYPALAQVPGEVARVGEIFPGTSLLDEGFGLADMEQQFREGHPSIVHIASHGEFSEDADASYVLTWDGRLTLDRVAELIRSSRFGDEPLELLVLSACQTALGDDRAALGLAGVAVQSGASSAVGSLWRIRDQSSAQLMGHFYESLSDPARTRAEALQQAQLALLRGGNYSHPRHWAPFLLINNWL